MLETNNAGYENSYEINYIIKSKIDNCVRINISFSKPIKSKMLETKVQVMRILMR